MYGINCNQAPESWHFNCYEVSKGNDSFAVDDLDQKKECRLELELRRNSSNLVWKWRLSCFFNVMYHLLISYLRPILSISRKIDHGSKRKVVQ